MDMLKVRSVKGQLALGFGAVVAILVYIVVTGASTANRQAATIESLIDDTMRRVTLLDDMQLEIARVNIAARTIALVEDAATQQREFDKIGAARAAYDASWKALVALPAGSPEVEARRNALVQARDRARPLLDAFLAAIEAGDRAGARSLLLDQMMPAQEAWLVLLEDNADAQAEAAAAAADAMKAAARQSIWQLMIEGALAVLASLLAAIFIARSLLRRLGMEPVALEQAATRIADNDFETVVPVRRGDERSVAAAMERMRRDLLARISAERVAAAENARIRRALDCARTNLMLLDADRRIVFANEAMRRFFNRFEAEIARTAPGYRADALLGKPIDALLPLGEDFMRRLGELRQPHIEEFPFAGRVVLQTMSRVDDADGNRAGTVVEWRDRFVETRIESEIGDLAGAAAAGDFSGRLALDDKDGFFRQLSQDLNG